ncbi:MAG TPA: N-acetylmuramic acid 6-phosphate etherase [Candidatus Dormibacteraeota bacterium]
MVNTTSFLTAMNEADASIAGLVRPALPRIAEAVEAIAARLAAGGRLHYFGAGTSGALAALDAMELPGTFGVAPDLVVAHSCLGAAEDDAAAGGAAAAAVADGDAAVAVSASGQTPYTVAALRAAAGLRVAVVCAAGSALAPVAQIAIEVPTGAEVLEGSTRLKAGTAQKMVLNMLSTGVFASLGYVYRGRMVGVVPDNAKLRARALGILVDLAGVSPDEAERALSGAGGEVRVALLMLRLGLDTVEARRRLAASRLPDLLE